MTAKSLTAKTSAAATGTGSTVKVRKPKTPKALALIVKRPPLESRDIDALIALIDANMSPRPAEPVEPTITDDMTVMEVQDVYRKYADDTRNHPRNLDNWTDANLSLLRARNVLNSTQLGIAVRPRKRHADAANSTN